MTTREPLESELKRRTRFGTLRHVATCSSTQDLAEESAKAIGGAPHDAVFWADHQEQGRGRQQRVWHDEPGRDLAVTFRASLDLADPVALPAALPVAVLQACAPFTRAALRIKWPNDVYAGGCKLAGVLVDRDSARPRTYRIGVGLNVNRGTFPEDLAAPGTSLRLLAGRELDREEVLLSLAVAVDAALTAIAPGGDRRGHEAAFRERLELLGREVSVTAGQEITGTLTAIDFERLVLDGDRALPLAIVTRLAPQTA